MSVTDETAKRKRRQERFLDALRQGVSITTACRAAGICKQTAYRWRKRSKRFAEAWDAAIEEGTDILEDRVLSKALKMDDHTALTAAIFILKARRPEKYRERHQIEHSGGLSMDIVLRARESVRQRVAAALADNEGKS